MTYLDDIRALGACSESIAWAKAGGYATLDAAWAVCEEPHWMLWYAGRMVGKARRPVEPAPQVVGSPSAMVEQDVWLYQLVESMLTAMLYPATRNNTLKYGLRRLKHTERPMTFRICMIASNEKHEAGRFP